MARPRIRSNQLEISVWLGSQATDAIPTAAITLRA